MRPVLCSTFSWEATMSSLGEQASTEFIYRYKDCRSVSFVWIYSKHLFGSLKDSETIDYRLFYLLACIGDRQQDYNVSFFPGYNICVTAPWGNHWLEQFQIPRVYGLNKQLCFKWQGNEQYWLVFSPTISFLFCF